MGLSMVALGSLFQAENTGVHGLVAMCFYMMGLGMSFGPIVWIMMSEIFPAPIRAQAMSMTIAAQWSANFLVSFTFPMMFGAMIMGLSMMALGALFENDNTGAYGLFAMCCYMVALGISFGPIVWIMMSEIFPAPIRGQAMSLAIAAQWGANFLVSFTFPVMFGNSTLNGFAHGGFAFWIYGAFGMLAAFVVFRVVPETKGVDGDQVAALWRRESYFSFTLDSGR